MKAPVDKQFPTFSLRVVPLGAMDASALALRVGRTLIPALVKVAAPNLGAFDQKTQTIDLSKINLSSTGADLDALFRVLDEAELKYLIKRNLGTGAVTVGDRMILLNTDAAIDAAFDSSKDLMEALLFALGVNLNDFFPALKRGLSALESKQQEKGKASASSSLTPGKG